MEKTAKSAPLKIEEKRKAECIMACIQIKEAFEMYAYRVIAPQSFIERVVEIATRVNDVMELIKVEEVEFNGEQVES